jgi:hypothetical protein
MLILYGSRPSTTLLAAHGLGTAGVEHVSDDGQHLYGWWRIYRKPTESTGIYSTRVRTSSSRYAGMSRFFFPHTPRIRSHAALLLLFIISFSLSLFRHDSCRFEHRTYGSSVCLMCICYCCCCCTFHWSLARATRTKVVVRARN